MQVNVPSDNSLDVATVRCGLCANLLTVNLQVQLEKLPLHKLQVQTHDDISFTFFMFMCSHYFIIFYALDFFSLLIPPYVTHTNIHLQCKRIYVFLLN